MDIHFMVNAYWESLEFEVPEKIGDRQCKWKLWIDTSAESPGDIHEMNEAPSLSEKTCKLCNHSIVVLIHIRE